MKGWDFLWQASLGMMLSWGLFRLAFQALTFHPWNRFFLMGSVLLSVLLPLIPLPAGLWAGPEAVLPAFDWTFADWAGTQGGMPDRPEAVRWMQAGVLPGLYLAVCFGLLFRLGWRWMHFFRRIRDLRPVETSPVKLYVWDEASAPFACLGRIYFDPGSYPHRNGPVYRHELVHARQNHSLDLVLFDVLLSFFWFNPFLYFLKRNLRQTHEFLADQGACGSSALLPGYLQELRDELVRRNLPGFVHSFHGILMKKRIHMLTKQKTKSRKKLRYALSLFLVAFLAASFRSPEPASQRSDSRTAVASLTTFLESSIDESPSRFPLPEAFREKVTWGFGVSARHPFTGEQTTHRGVDIAAPRGTAVYAVASGTVEEAREAEGWGKVVVILHPGGYQSVYAHLDSYSVKAGDVVKAGQTIAGVGNTGQSTGPHLHFEIRRNGEPVNPADYY
ncbi:MAG: peptidoglycan DD-metalloendopeptidase family protein [Bacteroidales bacterium]